LQSSRKEIIIRADADAAIGAGHLMRCLALGQFLNTQNYDVIFITACSSKDLLQRLRDEGFQVVTLAHPYPDPIDWRRTSKVLESLPDTWVMLDGYHFDAAYQRQIKAHGHRLLVIDDMAHLDRYCCDIVLNQNIHAEKLHYSSEANTRFLLGSRYILLRKEFLNWIDFKREVPKTAGKILITLGGADLDNQTLQFIRAMPDLALKKFAVAVVVGPANPHAQILESEAKHSNFPIQLIHNARNMPELMAWADMAISAGGSTCWELLFMGVPTLVTVTAENQQANAEGLKEAGAAVILGQHYNLSATKINRAVKKLATAADTRIQMSQRGQNLVDGRGVERVLREVMT